MATGAQKQTAWALRKPHWNHQLAYQEHSCTVPRGAIGRREREWNHSPPKNNLIKDSEGNEENGYLVLDSNITKINDAMEPNYAQKKRFCK
jgi:hypothetical protein